MDYFEAKKKIDEVCEWLKIGAPGASLDDIYETLQADVARYFCEDLLDAAGADGQGGCELCQM